MFKNKNNLAIVAAALLAICLYTQINGKTREPFKSAGCGCGK